jgi:hypothetical protein
MVEVFVHVAAAYWFVLLFLPAVGVALGVLNAWAARLETRKRHEPWWRR